MFAMGLSVLATGCASVVNEPTQAMRVDTLSNGLSVAGTHCSATNDHGSVQFRSSTLFQVHRSSQDLEIVCGGPQGVARGRSISRLNGAMAGNLLLGGAVGALVDHNRGAGYTYPTWIRLVFGEDLIFDRKDEIESGSASFPVTGRAPHTVK